MRPKPPKPMDAWHEVYDDAEVRYRTRCQVALLVGLGLVLSIALAVVAYEEARSASRLPVATGLALLWGLGTAAGLNRLLRLRRVVWCVKLSAAEVVAYDCTRHRTRFTWAEALRVEVNERGIAVAGPAGRRIEVGHRFRDFAAVSHRLVACAEAYHLPVLVCGRPWQQLDVYALYPYLADETSLHPPASRA